MPNGASYGWGICGKMITAEFKKRIPINFITSNFSQQSLQDELLYFNLKECVHTSWEKDEHANVLPVLQAIADHEMNPWGPPVEASFRLGYTFFENNRLSEMAIKNAQNFDLIATGSTWCRNVLHSYGITNTEAVLQGIDTQIFNATNHKKEYFTDKFVIFSGGKFEFRKGQDIVIAAIKKFMDKYDDVLFINSWYNLWPQTMQSIARSPFIKISNHRGTFVEIIEAILNENGIDTNRVITLPLLPNAQMAKIYKNTDIGLFPNRCEGGTNLVLMEYMACGKATLVSYFSGHCDVASESNAFLLKNLHDVQVTSNGTTSALWQEADIDEVFSQLEYAYFNRNTMLKIGTQASLDMQKITWEKTVENFLDLFNKNGISLQP